MLERQLPKEWTIATASHLEVAAEARETLWLMKGSGKRRIVVAPRAQADIFELYDADDSQSHTHIFVGDGAHARHYRLQVQTGGSHQSHLEVEQSENSQVQIFTLSAGSDHAQLRTSVVQNGPQAQCQIDGLYLAQLGQRVENWVRVEHKVPFGQSAQYFKGIVSERSHALFAGFIGIDQGAQKVNSRQLSRALLLGRNADIETRPELEIHADDVKASHGASIGQLNQDEVFYLQSRGLALKEAIRLLARAYLNDILMKIQRADCHDFIVGALEPALNRMEAAYIEMMEGGRL